MQMKDERPVVLHQGTYKKVATTSEAVFMITGMTIGAGILGLPYAVARAGLLPGIIILGALGVIMLFLNLMIGEVAMRTGASLQIPGMAGKYLGVWVRRALTVTFVINCYGVLLAYIVGEGQVLNALFGGSPLFWSVFFWSIGSFLIWGGLQRIKKIEKIISFTVIAVIAAMSLYLLPHISMANSNYFVWSNIFFPVGVILFALRATPAIAEAHALVNGDHKKFHRALVIGTLIPLAVYLLFTIAVVGVLGVSVTEVATIALGNTFGMTMAIIANTCAVLAMCTGFMGLGTALKESFIWDHNFPRFGSKLLVILIPLVLFAFGLRSFITIIDLIGGVLISFEAIVMTLVFLKARKSGDLGVVPAARHPYMLALPVLIFFGSVMMYNIYTFLIK